MCVTSGRATISDTMVYVYETDFGDVRGLRHVCGYQNQATNEAGGVNVMFLHFPGTMLELVRGPETTTSMMADMTANLPKLVTLRPRRGSASRSPAAYGARVENYGDYTTVLSQGSGDILEVLQYSLVIPANRRPKITDGLREMVAFYGERRPRHSFILACFEAGAKPKHPIVVSYRPHDRTILTAPGLDGHDGMVPDIGGLMRRDFQVAFGIRKHELPHAVDYQDMVSGLWAPSSVAGFHDNRKSAPNDDYRVPIAALKAGLTGVDLLSHRR